MDRAFTLSKKHTQQAIFRAIGSSTDRKEPNDDWVFFS